MKKRMMGLWFVLLCLGAGNVSASLITINSFEDFLPSGTRYVQSVKMEIDYENIIGDNLMIRDAATGEDSVVSGCYYMGFITYSSGNAYVVGYGENDFSTQPGWTGFMSGMYVTDTKYNGQTYTWLETGQRPDDIWFIYDGNEDGMGYYDTSSASWLLGEDDILYTSADILFGDNQIRGDISQLPAVGDTSNFLPHMIIAPVPEPATLFLLSLGYLIIRKEGMKCKKEK